jgi:hypothetical protein
MQKNAFYAGKKVMKGKGASAEADLPGKDELRKTIIGILKKVDFNTVSFSLDYGKHPEWLMVKILKYLGH